MIVLIATQEQYAELNGYQNGCDRLEFVKDGHGNWIITMRNLENPAFSEILPQLQELERVEYVPPVYNEEE